VDLSAEEKAQHLNLLALPEGQLADLRRHVVADLLALHEPPVTYCLLAVAALAVLHPFAGVPNQFALWLRGLTGAGKSFAAKLFACFFGPFGLAEGGFVTWASTANYTQQQGYYFRNTVCPVDDYKPSLIPHAQIVKILQALRRQHRPGPPAGGRPHGADARGPRLAGQHRRRRARAHRLGPGAGRRHRRAAAGQGPGTRAALPGALPALRGGHGRLRPVGAGQWPAGSLRRRWGRCANGSGGWRRGCRCSRGR
jgi:hypothetical protein